MNESHRPDTRSDSESKRPRRRLGRRALDGLARSWRDTVYLHERLLEAQRPWEQQATIRSRRQIGGWRLVGSYLPDDDVGPPAGSPRSGTRGSDPSRPRGPTPCPPITGSHSKGVARS
jgi:hypothetical protein